MRVISTNNAPAAIGPYSQGMIVGNLVYTSGQIPVDPKTGAIAGDTIETQAEQSLKNVKAIAWHLKEVLGLDMARLKTKMEQDEHV